MRLEEAKKILENTRRRNIRYVLYRLKESTEEQNDMPHGELLDAVRVWYSHQLKEIGSDIGWKNFADRWDIGIDDGYTLRTRWESLLDKQWYTMGIDKLKVVRNPGSPSLQFPFGDGRIQVTPAMFFLASGYATEEDGRVLPDVEKILAGVGNRESWL